MTGVCGGTAPHPDRRSNATTPRGDRGRWRGVIAGVLFLGSAGPAWAEVCDKVTEGWDSADGPVGFWGEALSWLLSIPGIFLLCLTLAVMLVGWRWLLLGAAILPLGFAILLVIGSDNEVMRFEMDEGCVGPVAGAIAPFALMCSALFAMGLKPNLLSRQRP